MDSQNQYTPEQLNELNDKKHCSIPPELIHFFSKFPKVKITGNNSISYKNPYNIYLNEIKNRNKIFKAPEAFTDEKVVADLKEIVSKLTEQNKEEIISNFLKIQINENCMGKVAEMLHTVAIDCIFLAQVYADLFKRISTENPKLFKVIDQRIQNQLYHPRVFDSAMDEIACETSVQKANKWRLNNSILIANFYLKGIYSSSYIVNDVLVPIINGIKVEDPFNITILKEVMPLIRKQLDEDGANLSDIFSRIGKISKDKAYPARLRFLLMDIRDSAEA